MAESRSALTAEARESMRALRLELSDDVWRDVNAKVEAVCAALESAEERERELEARIEMLESDLRGEG